MLEMYPCPCRMETQTNRQRSVLIVYKNYYDISYFIGYISFFLTNIIFKQNTVAKKNMAISLLINYCLNHSIP